MTCCRPNLNARDADRLISIYRSIRRCLRYGLGVSLPRQPGAQILVRKCWRFGHGGGRVRRIRPSPAKVENRLQANAIASRARGELLPSFQVWFQQTLQLFARQTSVRDTSRCLVIDRHGLERQEGSQAPSGRYSLPGHFPESVASRRSAPKRAGAANLQVDWNRSPSRPRHLHGLADPSIA